ncbi:MAG: hypothetical protein HOL51_18445 [Gemmatimonadetes bacterium]|nr:hypothetical protein [Gemmatimonadota bacterium]MBT5328094.1 hypothetical protein [Gemmatimonadota bacterium]MBT6619399.1 hypothetical protein [Gemmatimonadota bacterium]MBT6904179.1 hypothetical protein [Gemmatimonadota bacterium]MBT7421848.1 hypothetical protein [Gemmatimonadota bacterium]
MRQSYANMLRGCGLIIGLLLLNSTAVAQGHRLTGNQVIVEGRRHWENWTFPHSTLEVSAAGVVTPRLLRKNVNAVFDIVDFMRLHPPPALGSKAPEDIQLLDAIQAGSNREDVALIMDGDMTTYWEPETPLPGVDLASQWWFTIDLGRFVFIEKLVFKFADEEQGDPFLLFDVLVSNGLNPVRVPSSKTPNFKTVLRLLQPNKSQRVFEIDFADVAEAQSEGVRFVQVVVNGSDLDRAREVSQEAYETLDAVEQGVVEYNKRLVDGREVVVKQSVYEQLDAERRGSVRYFRRERPRLAEMEVWSTGDEIANGTIARGGFITSTQQINTAGVIDGSILSFGTVTTTIAEISDANDLNLDMFFDLGSYYWIDTHRIVYNPGNVHARSFFDYQLDFSDGARAANGELDWTTAFFRQQEATLKAVIEGNRFDLVKARFFRLQAKARHIRGNGLVPVAEMQLYGAGFQPRVDLESDLIRLGGSRNLLSIEWVADVSPGTSVQIQTRTGNQLGEILHYYKKDGTEVTESQYGKLLSIFKGDIVPEEVPGNDWSGWSEPYTLAAGSVITSPSPREFLKVRAILVSDDPQVSASLKSIRLDFVDPVAQGLIGEVVPFQVDSLGVDQPFSLYIRPKFDRGDSGFDELLLVSPPDMVLEFTGIYGGREADFMSDSGDISGLSLSGAELVTTGSDSLQIAFDAIDPNAGMDVLRLDFRTTLFATGAVLRPSLQQRGSTTSTWQRVDGGNAIALGTGNTTTLVSSVGQARLIREVVVRPPAFSPNGDGINDETAFEFKVVRVGDDSPAEVWVYDLAGRLMRRLVEQRKISTGEHALRWDGRDQTGEVVPPGIYYARLRVATETDGAGIENAEVLRTVSVAY